MLTARTCAGDCTTLSLISSYFLELQLFRLLSASLGALAWGEREVQAVERSFFPLSWRPRPATLEVERPRMAAMLDREPTRPGVDGEPDSSCGIVEDLGKDYHIIVQFFFNVIIPLHD